MTTTRQGSITGAAVLVVSLAGCGLLFGGGSPRQNDPNSTRPIAPAGVTTWSSLEWQDVTFERPVKVSQEQWDQPGAVAAGPGGFVAVGSNSDVMGYVGRIWTSVDGLDWRLVEAPMLDGLELVGVAASSETYVAIGTRSADINAPVASILTSPDGTSWIEAKSIADTWASRVRVGDPGFAIVVQTAPGDGTDLLFSPDGSSWNRMPGDQVAPDAWIADIAWDGNGWIAAGSVGDRAAVWRSHDGTTWTEEPLPASGPIDGIIDVSAYRVVPGRWATIVLGLERAPSCEEDDDFCPKYQVAWSWTAAGGWVRLPAATWILDRGYGIDLYPANDAGFLYLLGRDPRLSADGWDWAPVRETNATDALMTDVLVTPDRVIGIGNGSGPDLVGWFGTALIRR